jgi:hypothetical protein
VLTVLPLNVLPHPEVAGSVITCVWMASLRCGPAPEVRLSDTR